MGVFSLYLDESERPSEVLTIAGYIASVDQWDNQRRQWDRLREEFNFDVFHAADLQAFLGEFTGWDEAKRQRLHAEMAEIIRARVAFAVSSGILLGSYERLVGQAGLRQIVGGPAYVCMLQIIKHASDWARFKNLADDILYFYESGYVGASDVLEAHRNEKQLGLVTHLGPMVFLPKKEPALQLADFHAYESMKHILNLHLTRNGRPIRKSLELCAEDIPVMDTFLDEGGLAGMLDSLRREGKLQ